MLELALFFLLFCISLGVVGVFIGKNIFIKIMFLNSTTILVTLFICTLGSFGGNGSYLDIAIIYFALSFIATNGYLKYFLSKQSNNK